MKIPKQSSFKSYLLGYVVYYTLDNIQGDNHFYLEERVYQNSALIKVEEPYYHSDVYGFECGVNIRLKTERIFKENRIKIFPNLDKALEAAKKFKADNNLNSVFVRMWKYSSNIPKHAKGLKPFPKNVQTIWAI
jgi:hypothetical protein